MIFTIMNKRDHDAQSACMHCKKPFGQMLLKYRHHDHSNGKYRYALCNSCNLRTKNCSAVPCLVHNLPYDICSFVRNLERFSTQAPFVIAPSSEKIRYLKFDSIAFIDTMQYAPVSLASLVDNHKASDLPFSCLKQEFKNKVNVLTRKGVFPYSFITSWDSYDHQGLPEQKFFNNDLSGEKCPDEDYKFACQIFRDFGCQDLKDYSMLYLKTDVLLLADCMVGLREGIFKNHNIDLFQHVSLPQAAWNAAMLFSGVEIELFQDPNMFLLSEASIRGGVVQQSVRYLRANNPRCPDYNPEAPEASILYVDANNLYGSAMCEPLPVGKYEWVANIRRNYATCPRLTIRSNH